MKMKSLQNVVNLENKIFWIKLLKRSKPQMGIISTKQEKILKYVENFYKNLFSNKENDLENVDLNELLKDCQADKVNNHTLGKTISTLELNEVLKKMKHNKSPGMDGIACDILKVFWGKLKFLVTRTLNTCFQKGKLSTTLRQGIITCIYQKEQLKIFIKKLENNFTLMCDL